MPCCMCKGMLVVCQTMHRAVHSRHRQVSTQTKTTAQSVITAVTCCVVITAHESITCRATCQRSQAFPATTARGFVHCVQPTKIHCALKRLTSVRTCGLVNVGQHPMDLQTENSRYVNLPLRCTHTAYEPGARFTKYLTTHIQ